MPGEIEIDGSDDAAVSSEWVRTQAWSRQLRATFESHQHISVCIALLCICLSIALMHISALRRKMKKYEDDDAEAKKRNEALDRLEREFERNWPEKRKRILGSKEYAYVRGESVQRLLEEEWVIPSNVSKELGLIFDLLARDFIFSWYNDIQAYQETDHGLIGDIQALFVQACGIIFRRLLALNLVIFLLGKTSDVVRRHLLWFHEMRQKAAARNVAAFRDVDDISQASYERRNALIMDEFRREKFEFHPACRAYSQGKGEAEHLRSVVDVLLKNVLSRKDKGCNAFVRLVREVLVSSVLRPAIACATPHLINTVLSGVLATPTETSVGSDTTSSSTDSLMPLSPTLASSAGACTRGTSASSTSDATPVESPMQQHAQQSYDVDGSDDTQTHRQLVHSTQAAIDALISDFLRNPNAKIDASSESCSKLVTAIESVFLHGLRRSPDRGESYWAYVKHVGSILPEARDDVNDISRGEGVGYETQSAKRKVGTSERGYTQISTKRRFRSTWTPSSERSADEAVLHKRLYFSPRASSARICSAVRWRERGQL